MSSMPRPIVQLTERLVERQPSIEYWQQVSPKRTIRFDQRTDLGIEGAVSELRRQLDAEHLEQATDLILQVNALVEHRLAAGEQRTDVMACHALDMYRPVPTGAQQLSNTPCVVLVGLVAHGGQRVS